jgi:hypothetical protein
MVSGLKSTLDVAGPICWDEAEMKGHPRCCISSRGWLQRRNTDVINRGAIDPHGSEFVV